MNTTTQSSCIFLTEEENLAVHKFIYENSDSHVNIVTKQSPRAQEAQPGSRLRLQPGLPVRISWGHQTRECRVPGGGGSHPWATWRPPPRPSGTARGAQGVI